MSPMTRPLIGINTDFFAANKTQPARSILHAGYYDAVMNAGGLPVIIPPLAKEQELDALLDRLDGVILTGGLDMDPRRLSQPGHSAIQPMAERRELSDRILARRIVERRVSVLAIGVGMQQINAATGGTLFLHIPADLPKAMPHFDQSGGPHRHIVMLESNTKIEEIYGCLELRVNSMHHQAVNTVGPKMQVGARSPDGVIESIESTASNWFCLGVQWHPESDTASALDMQMFECFIQASVRSSNRLQAAAA